MEGIIKAKSTGLDLSSHTHSVLNTALIFNKLGKFNLNVDIIKWSCILHDVGKANPLFQKNMEENSYDNVCRHEISSLLFINAVPKRIRDKVAFVILSHHKSIDEPGRSFIDLYDTSKKTMIENHVGDIGSWGKEVVDYLYEYHNKKIKVPTVEDCVKTIEYYVEKYDDIPYDYSKYRGLVMWADHFASCYDDDTERLNIIRKLFRTLDTSFYNGKDERYPLSLVNSDVSRKHTFVIAPTGCGKTNFMMKRCRNRIFYTLPFQASINAMYQRLKNDVGGDEYVGLMHASMSALSFLDDREKELSKFFGLPMKVITPFQVMSCLIQTKGYEGMIMDLEGQDVILDEIHTYSETSLSAVVELVKMLKKLNCGIHICTATIPTVFADELIRILGENETQIVKLNEEQLKTFNRHIIHVNDEMSVGDIVKESFKGNKVLVVKNTVSEAQDMYERISRYISKCGKHIDIELIHSRLRRCDKVEKERILMDYNRRTLPCIVVSTQVVEVSLDINFDVMFTDNADIMSLIQRFGRVNRQRGNIGVYKHIYVSRWDPPYPAKGVAEIYPKEIRDRTFEKLCEYDRKLLPENDIQKIIDYVHPAYDVKKNEVFSPYTEDGRWKVRVYSHNSADSLASALEVVGYTGILKSDIDTYLKTFDKGLEIPIRVNISEKDGHARIKRKLVNAHINERNGKPDFYIIEDRDYSEEYGLRI